MAKIKLPLRQFYWVNLYDMLLVPPLSLSQVFIFINHIVDGTALSCH